MDSERLDRLPLTLNNRECAALLGISTPTFWKYRKRGVFRGLEAPIPGRWSRDKVIAWLGGQQTTTLGRKAVA